LERDPETLEALYEMAFSYYAKRDLRKTLEIAQKGVTSKNRFRPAFFTLIGNAQDELGNTPAAISAYEAGIRENPAYPLLHFNLGVAYYGQKDWKKARAAFERAVSLRPDHSSGHFYLAKTYEKEAFKVPAFLAYVRFLTLEPTGPRSRAAVESLGKLFNLGYAKEAKTGNVTLTLNTVDKKEEGDFEASELGMLMSQAAGGLDENGKKLGEPAATIKKLSDAIAITVETTKESSQGFAASYYLPYFHALHKSNRSEAACYFVLQSSDVPGVKEWLEKNKTSVDNFLAWSMAFTWPQTMR
jgi:hypothetical protein